MTPDLATGLAAFAGLSTLYPYALLAHRVWPTALAANLDSPSLGAGVALVATAIGLAGVVGCVVYHLLVAT